MNKEKIYIYYDNEIVVEYISSDGRILTSPIAWQERLKSLLNNKIYTISYIGDSLRYEYENLVLQIDSWVKVARNSSIVSEYIKEVVSTQISNRVKTTTTKKLKARNIDVKKDELDYKPLTGSINIEPNTSSKSISNMNSNLNITKSVVKPRIVTRKNKYSSGKIVAGMLLIAVLIGEVVHLTWVDETNKVLDKSSSDIKIMQELENNDYLPTIPPIETLGITSSTINNNVYLSYEDRSQDIKALQTKSMYGAMIEKNAKKCGIDPRIVFGIATQESGDHEYGLRHGSTGGLMQIEIDYWRNEEITYYDFDDATEYTIKITDEIIQDVDNNILIGCAILQNELKMYNYNILLAIQGYNEGYSNMSKILNATSKETGLTKMQIINDNNCYEWTKYTNVINAGDPNYINNVLSYTGFGYDFYDFYCKTPEGQIKTCTTLPITSVDENMSEVTL